MKKFLIILLLSISNCGYQPLYVDANNEELIFKEIDLRGDKKINRKIISTLNISKDSTNYNYEELILDSKKNTRITAKNSKGEAVSYKKSIETVLITINKDGEKVNKSFNADFSYGTKKNKFELAEYEKQVEGNLIEEITEDIIIYINLR